MEKYQLNAPATAGYVQAVPAFGAPPSQGLIGDAGTLPARLVTILDRVRSLKIAIHGHHPEPAADKASPPEPNHENMRRFVDRSHVLLEQIEGELANIEGRL